jgi:putative endonuclease
VVEGELQMIRWLKSLWNKLKPDPVAPPREEAEAGRRGEQAAADFLHARQGYGIVTRNWRSPRDQRDEIDLVCRDGDVLVFVEVKARAEGARVSGYLAVDERKKRALRRAVQAYLGQLVPPPRTFRFDIVEVTLSNRLPAQVMHYENAPLFPKGYYLARQNPASGPEGA